MFCLYIFLWTIYVSDAPAGQETKILGLPGSGVKIVVTHNMDGRESNPGPLEEPVVLKAEPYLQHCKLVFKVWVSVVIW